MLSTPFASLGFRTAALLRPGRPPRQGDRHAEYRGVGRAKRGRAQVLLKFPTMGAISPDRKNHRFMRWSPGHGPTDIAAHHVSSWRMTSRHSGLGHLPRPRCSDTHVARCWGQWHTTQRGKARRESA